MIKKIRIQKIQEQYFKK